MNEPQNLPSVPADDAILWRYMSFTKFASLLTKKALFFARADKLGDPFEGSLSPLNEELYPFIHGTMAPEHQETHRLLFRNLPRFTLLNCWHENETESDAMWKLYTGNREGIAIRTTCGSLKESLSGEEWVNIGRANYVDYDNTHIRDNDSMVPFLHKRKSFEHEREVRAIIRKPYRANNQIIADGPDICDVGIYCGVDVHTLIKEVFVPPYAEDWFAELVQATAETYGLQAPVKRSALSALPVWI